MSDTNTGGSAFPVVSESYSDVREEGMTLRDYFAAKAMQSLVEVYKDDKLIVDQYAQRAYEIADAMLKARQA